MPFRDVLANSSNVGTIKVCQRLAPETYFTWIEDFGFGSPSGTDLPGEVGGMLRPPDRWSKLTQSSMAFGQELSATPIQLTSAVAAIANGGLLMRPQVMRELRGRDGQTVRVNAPEIRNRVLNESVADRVAAIMEHVVRSGTGRPASVDGYRIAGKTSTAQKIDPATGRYSKYVAGFVGFLPVSDPRIVILVMIDEPRRDLGHGGSRAAAPVFREVALAAIRILRIAPDDLGPRPAWVTGGPAREVETGPAGGMPPVP
jgi:cell division protein FtsI (penicillin-binding protein 3)